MIGVLSVLTILFCFQTEGFSTKLKIHAMSELKKRGLLDDLLGSRDFSDTIFNNQYVAAGTFETYTDLLLNEVGRKAIFSRAERGDLKAQYIWAFVGMTVHALSDTSFDENKHYYFWMRKSAKGGFPPALLMLAHDEKDNKKRLSLLKEATGKRYPIAFRELAEYYSMWDSSGDGRKDGRWNYDVIKNYERAAELGDCKSIETLGEMYFHGYHQGSPDSKWNSEYFKSAKWYKKGADLGSPQSLFMLGKLFEEGKGAIQNYREAFRLYSQSADSGHSGSLQALGRLYEFGIGVTEDDVLAYIHYSLASAVLGMDGYPKNWSSHYNWKIISLRDEVASRLTVSQMNDAQRISTEKFSVLKKVHKKAKRRFGKCH